MSDADLIPLRLVSGTTRIYANLSGEAKEVVIWAACHGADGHVRAGPDDTRGLVIRESDGTAVVKAVVEANESVVASPGSGGVIAIRLVQV